MPINSLQEKFTHELADIYDAEHQFLKGQEELLQNATDPKLKEMLTQHIEETRQQIKNLEQVFSLLAEQPRREMCDGARGLVSEGQKLIREIPNQEVLRDCAIVGAANKVEHYEISTYRGLITGAELTGQQEVADLLEQNLQQEERTAERLEQSLTQFLQQAAQVEGTRAGDAQAQAYPTV